MNVQTRSSSKHITFAAHAPHAISAESVVRSTQISARARIASRSGVGVGVGTASTTAKPSFNGESRGRSQAQHLEGHPVLRHSKRRTQILRRMSLAFARVCSDW